MDLFIEFDRQQLTFRTNIPEVAGYLTDTFCHMLVPAATNSVGMTEFNQTPEGYALRSAESIDYEGIALEEFLPLMKDEVRLQFMRARPDLLWMHAGAIERAGGALLLAAKSGQGKSTLSTYLCGHGWKFLSDDIAPIRMDTDIVIPFPQLPVRRLHPGREVGEGELHMLERETVPVSPVGVRRDDTDIRGIVFIEYVKGADAKLVTLDQGSAAIEILRNATNFWDHKSAAVERAAHLVGRIVMYRLAYDQPHEAVEVVNKLW